MVDTSPLLASLLLGQKRRVDPIESQRAFGQKLILQGSSTAPLQSGHWLEGLARALQGGVGGLVAGSADQMEKEKGQKTVEALGRISGAKNQDELTAAIKGTAIDPDLAGPLMAQILQHKQSQFGRDSAATSFGTGLPGTPATPAATQTAAAAPPGTIPPEWAPHIQTAAQTTGLPPELLQKVLLAESGGNANAVSPAGAGGPAQLMPGTARDLGVANRFDPATAIPGGASYLKQQLDKYGNLPHALAAYNWGPGNVDGWLKAGADPSKLPAETQAYIAKIAGGGQPQQQAAPPGAPQMQGDAGPQVAPVPSATSQPPEVPRPQPTPEQVQRYKTLIASPNGMTVEQANQALNKEIHDQWAADKQRAMAIWQDQQQSRRLQETGAQKLGLEGPMNLIKDRVSTYEKEIRPKGMAAVQEIDTIHQARQLLDAGVFSGTGMDAQAAGSRLGQAFGFDWGTDRQANTAALQSTMASRVLDVIKSLGANPSNADRIYLEKAKGGDLSMGEGALREILDIGERTARRVIKSHDVEAARTKQLTGVGQLGDQQFQLPEAPTYEAWKQANPLAGPQAQPQQPQAQQAGGYKEGDTATNPQTRQKMIFQGGGWRQVGG